MISNYTRHKYFKSTTNWLKLPDNVLPIDNMSFLSISTLPMTSFTRIMPLAIYITSAIDNN